MRRNTFDNWDWEEWGAAFGIVIRFAAYFAVAVAVIHFAIKFW